MAFLYPWGNTQQLNLDWILQKIKELEAGSGGADLDEVANALISATYARQAYDRSDIVFYDGKLYRANQAIPAPGEVWTPAHWDEILLGDTVSNLVQYVAALSNDQIANNSNVSGTYTSDALDTLKAQIDGMTVDSDNVSNVSQVTGDNVSDALDNLDGAITTVETQISAYIETENNASRTYAISDYILWNDSLYRVKTAIPTGTAFSIGTNIELTTVGESLKKHLTFVTHSLMHNSDFCSSSSARVYTQGRFGYPNGWFILSAIPTNPTDVLLTGLPIADVNSYIEIYDQDSKDIVVCYIEANTGNLIVSRANLTGRIGHYLNFISYPYIIRADQL